MTRSFLILAGVGALAAAAPAAAQPYGDYGNGYDSRYDNIVDTQSLRADIDAGVARGEISSREAISLRSQLRGLVNLQRQYEENGLSWREREDLQQRAQGLRNEIASAGGYDSGSQRYDNRYGGAYDNRGYGNRYGGTYGNGGYNNGYAGTYGNRYGSTYGNSGYNNGYAGTYGNGDNGAYRDNNGAYRDNRADTYRNDTYRNDTYRNDGDRDDDSYDRDDEGGYALRVGDRVTGGLYAVPDAYRTRFRDGGGVYYRYGSGNVYQVDAATGRVLRIYTIDR